MSPNSVEICLEIDGRIFPFGQAENNIEELSTEGKRIHRSKNDSMSLVRDDNVFVFSDELTSDSRLLIAIEFPEQVIDKDLLTFIGQISDQLHVLIVTKNYREAREKERLMFDALLAVEQFESDIWDRVLDSLLEYPPDWCPGKRQCEIQQFLLARHNEETMHLVAGDGAGSRAEYVLMNETVTGSAVLENWKKPTLKDLRETQRVVSYGKKRLDYELVVPIIDVGDDRVIATLNLETDEKPEVNPLIQSFYGEAASFLAPILKTIQERSSSYRSAEVRLQYVLSDMLQRLGGTFTHMISQPFLIAKMAAGEIRYQVDRPKFDQLALVEEISTVSSTLDAIERDCLKFVSELPDFLEVGPVNVKKRLLTRLTSLSSRARHHCVAVQYKFHNSGEDAFASSLFAEHVFNICFNSLQQILEAERSEKLAPGSGQLKVRSRYKKSLSPSGDAKGVDFIEITIWDNAGGMTETVLEKTKRGHTTKLGGNGYAIPAALDYFASIGGEMTYGNFRGGLRTKIRLQAYDPSRHHTRKIGNADREEAGSN